MKQIITLLSVCLSLVITQAQTPDTLSLEMYLQQIKCCHPVSRIADYNVLEKQFYTMAARGAFDPQLNGDFDRKSFDDKTYYQHVNAGVSGFILPGGIGYSAGYELNAGTYLNPEARTPNNGLYYAGIEVPLFQGMTTDSRRTALRQAQTLQLSSEEERKLALNELIFRAYTNFVYWYAYHELEQLYVNQVRFTEERLENIRSGVILGDRAAMDTADARAMLANWQMGLAETRSLKIKYSYMIAADLWNEDGSPRNTDIMPVPKTDALLQQLNDAASVSLSEAPKLRLADYKTEFYRLERRLKAEYLKPKLNLKYNFLYGTPQQATAGPFLFENYKAGLKFSMPLLLRTERGEWRAAEVKWKAAQLSRDFLAREMETKLQSAYLEIVQSREFYENARQLSVLSRTLADAEQSRFDAGDSNFFTLFLRETNYINAVQKRIKAEAELKLILLKPRYIAGTLAE